MKIAIPVSNKQLCPHFGHCAEFALIDVNDSTKEILATTYATPPAHEPGVLPQWLHEQNVNLILAGGMGSRAQQLFEQNGIRVLAGCPPVAPLTLAEAYLNNDLQTGANACDH